MRIRFQWAPWAILACVLALPKTALGVGIDDVLVRYSRMKITKVTLSGQTQTPNFYRHLYEVKIGVGRATLGVMYQVANKSQDTIPGKRDEGLMFNLGYNRLLSEHLRVESHLCIGITETDPSQPLYATDSQANIRIVMFEPDGYWLGGDYPAYPSAYAGTIVNRYGRVQGVVGAGVWWRGVGAYVTALDAFNGVTDPLYSSTDQDIRFAHLDNRAVTVEMSYEFRDVGFRAKKTIPLRNGGNGLTFAIDYRIFL